jgi:hypothetical protein
MKSVLNWIYYPPPPQMFLDFSSLASYFSMMDLNFGVNCVLKKVLTHCARIGRAGRRPPVVARAGIKSRSDRHGPEPRPALSERRRSAPVRLSAAHYQGRRPPPMPFYRRCDSPSADVFSTVSRCAGFCPHRAPRRAAMCSLQPLPHNKFRFARRSSWSCRSRRSCRSSAARCQGRRLC